MNNLRIYKEILMEDCEYWIGAKNIEYNTVTGRSKKPDEILLFSIEPRFGCGLDYEGILLSEIEELKASNINTNIFLNTNFPPFQVGQSLSSLYQVYPIKTNINKFLREALALDSDSFYDYKRLYESLTQNED